MTSSTTDDPFTTGQVQFAWDSTSMGWLKTCPRKYYYSMIEGWRGKHESVHLTFGILYHSALEGYDRARAAGSQHDEALRSVVQQSLIQSHPWKFDHNSKTRENLIRSIIWYCDHFKDDPAQTVLLSSGEPAVELSFRMDLPWSTRGGVPYMLCGHLDRVVSFNGLTFVMDRKTTTSTPASNYFDRYEPDNQMTAYTVAAKVIYNQPIRGVIIDAAQIAVGFTRFVRGITYRTPAQLDEWLRDFQYWTSVAEDYATSGYWPMNDTACDKYGGCPFRKVCASDPSVRQATLESEFSQENKWNPLEVR